MIKISSTAHLNTLCIIEWAMVTEQGVDKILNWNLQGIMNDYWKGVNKNTSLEICKGE